MADFKNCTKTIKDCPNCPKLFECDEYEQLETTAKVENGYAKVNCMTSRVIIKNVSSCEECPYYETSEHEDYGIYYTTCCLFDNEIKSKDYYQPKALFVMCQLPTEKENFIKSSK